MSEIYLFQFKKNFCGKIKLITSKNNKELPVSP